MPRDFNRVQDQKALKKAREIAKRILLDSDLDDIEKLANQLRHNRTPCSCPMCCNPRHSIFSKGKDKLTIQEKRNGRD